MNHRKLINYSLVFFLFLFSFNMVPVQQPVLNESEISIRNIKIKSSDLPDFSDLSIFHLNIRLVEEENAVNGNYSVNYYNTHDLIFDALPFHLYLPGMAYSSRPGSINITSVISEVEPYNEMEFQVLTDENLLWVNLTNPINQGEWANFTIHFESILPDGDQDRSNIFGSDYGESKIYKYAVAYPMLCVYDSYDEWNLDPYLHVGDPFYSAMAFQTMTLTVPKEMIVAGTGKIISSITQNNETTYVFDPDLPVRELTFSASRYFIQESMLWDDVNISIYYLEDAAYLWSEEGLEIAENAFDLYSTIGNYPYSTLNIVEEYTQHGGMEHPLQIYISSDYSDYVGYNPYFSAVVAHEIAHQWFYHLVGNDEVDVGHLDEGIVCWLDDWYADTYVIDNAFENYVEIEGVIAHSYQDTSDDVPVNTSILDYNNPNDYWFNAYHKAPALLEKLRGEIGHEVFIGGLALLFERFQFKIAWFPDLQTAMEDIYGQSLDWFFNPWFDNAQIPRYYFRDASYISSEEKFTVTIYDAEESSHTYPYNQRLQIELEGSNNKKIYTGNHWINGTTEIILEGISEKPDYLVITKELNAIFEIPNSNEEELKFVLVNIEQKSSIPAYPVISIGLIGCGMIFALIRSEKKETVT